MCGFLLARRDALSREVHPGGDAGASLVGWRGYPPPRIIDYRQQIAYQVEAAIGAHGYNDDGRCGECDEDYPCGPRRLAEHAADALARRLRRSDV
jgi:hypothetical protein